MKLTDILEEANILQLSKKSKLSRRQLIRIRNGECEPYISTYSRICVALGYDPVELIVNEDYFIRR